MKKYHVELDRVSDYTEFDGPDNMTRNEILEKAISNIVEDIKLFEYWTKPLPDKND